MTNLVRTRTGGVMVNFVFSVVFFLASCAAAFRLQKRLGDPASVIGKTAVLAGFLFAATMGIASGQVALLAGLLLLPWGGG